MLVSCISLGLLMHAHYLSAQCVGACTVVSWVTATTCTQACLVHTQRREKASHLSPSAPCSELQHCIIMFTASSSSSCTLHTWEPPEASSPRVTHAVGGQVN